MSTKTTIEWTDHTFNPFWGCTEVSPGCDNCYAREWARRFGVKWGPGETRKLASERTWAEPLKWNAKAAKNGVRRRVFCASMADIFDNEGPPAAREWLWELIEETPSLDWLLLTKRIGNVMSMVPARWQQAFPRHIWIGATIVNQEEADRDIPKLLRVPAAVRFLSCEPLLGPINLRELSLDNNVKLDALSGFHSGPAAPLPAITGHISWVIVGGESGRKARPMHPEWARSLRDQCIAAYVPYHFKQWGEWLPGTQYEQVHRDTDSDDVFSRFDSLQWDGDQWGSHDPLEPSGAEVTYRVGKALAGRAFDGRTWDEFPRIKA